MVSHHEKHYNHLTFSLLKWDQLHLTHQEDTGKAPSQIKKVHHTSCENGHTNDSWWTSSQPFLFHGSLFTSPYSLPQLYQTALWRTSPQLPNHPGVTAQQKPPIFYILQARLFSLLQFNTRDVSGQHLSPASWATTPTGDERRQNRSLQHSQHQILALIPQYCHTRSGAQSLKAFLFWPVASIYSWSHRQKEHCFTGHSIQTPQMSADAIKLNLQVQDTLCGPHTLPGDEGKNRVT